MKVELLYFDGCPTYWKTLGDLVRIMKEEGIDVKVDLVRVESDNAAKRLGFLGSPTVRVDGIDVDPRARTSQDFGLKCRVYLTGGKVLASPPDEMLREALH